MNNAYSARRDFADNYLTQIRQLLSSQFCIDYQSLRLSDFFEDTKQATDLVNTVTRERIAVRTRRPAYRKHLGQFTVRTSGVPSELYKLRAGFADLMFYSYADEQGNLAEWDLMEVSPALLRYPISSKSNGIDSNFNAYRINPAAVIAKGKGFNVVNAYPVLRIRVSNAVW